MPKLHQDLRPLPRPLPAVPSQGQGHLPQFLLNSAGVLRAHAERMLLHRIQILQGAVGLEIVDPFPLLLQQNLCSHGRRFENFLNRLDSSIHINPPGAGAGNGESAGG